MQSGKNGVAVKRSVEVDPFDPANAVTDATSGPDRIILYAGEGWGKTSFAAQVDNAFFLMSKGEDGLKTLIRTGQLPPVRHFPEPASLWDDVMRALNGLAVKMTEPGTLVLDTWNGLERLCQESICQQHFKGDWIVFDRWAQGNKACIPVWGKFLESLDRLRDHGWAILALAHAIVEKVPNPDGTDYDRWQPASDKKYLWPISHKWFDIIMRGGFETFVEKADAKALKGKASGGRSRILDCQPSATCVAKNRHGLPEQIVCGDSPAEAWASFVAALYPQQEGE